MKIFVPGHTPVSRGLNWEGKGTSDRFSAVNRTYTSLARSIAVGQPILFATTSASGTRADSDLPITVAEFHVNEINDSETSYLLMWILGVRWDTGTRNICMKVYINDEWLLTDGHGGTGGAEYCVAGFTPITPPSTPFDVKLVFDWLDTPPSSFVLRRGRYLMLRCRESQRS